MSADALQATSLQIDLALAVRLPTGGAITLRAVGLFLDL